MDFSPISKAVAATLATVATTGITVVAIPSNVEAPWWGHVLVGVVNAAIAFAVVYFAPKNKN